MGAFLRYANKETARSTFTAEQMWAIVAPLVLMENGIQDGIQRQCPNLDMSIGSGYQEHLCPRSEANFSYTIVIDTYIDMGTYIDLDMGLFWLPGAYEIIIKMQ
jgi:hypothetical protein